MSFEKREKLTEWTCWLLLTVHFWFCASGYITYFQTKNQLTTPLIPESTILVISEPSFFSALSICGSFIISLWLYFFRKRIAVIILSAISIVAYEVLLVYFIR
jgi:hypothetical protein